MVCPKCGSENVNVQMVTETHLKKKGKGIVWWLTVGWWWWIVEMFLWLFLTLPRLIVAIFKPKNHKIKTTHKSMCVCQNCGNHWKSK